MQKDRKRVLLSHANGILLIIDVRKSTDFIILLSISIYAYQISFKIICPSYGPFE